MADIYTDTYANIPAAGTSGDLFLPSDGVSIYRDSGSAWVPWGPKFPCAEPVNGDFSWVNQGGASVDATYGGIYLQAPAGAAAANLRVRVKTAPSTPYTITAWVIPHLYAYIGPKCGLTFRESSSGKLHILSLVGIPWTFGSSKYTNATTFSADYATLIVRRIQLLCLRIADDGANRICSWSVDGQHFFQLHSVGRTDFLTADQVGFFVDSFHATLPAGMTLLSWAET
jgi:hypothetical protein